MENIRKEFPNIGAGDQKKILLREHCMMVSRCASHDTKSTDPDAFMFLLERLSWSTTDSTIRARWKNAGVVLSSADVSGQQA